MVRLTLIARQRDGLPLAEGLDNDKDRDLSVGKQQAKVWYTCPTAQHLPPVLHHEGSAHVEFCGNCVLLYAARNFRSTRREAPWYNCWCDTRLKHQCAVQQMFKKLAAQRSSAPEKLSAEAGAHTFHVLNSNGVSFLTLAERNYPKKLAYQYLDELSSEFNRLYGGQQVESVSRPYAFIKFGMYSLCAGFVLSSSACKQFYPNSVARTDLLRLRESLYVASAALCYIHGSRQMHSCQMVCKRWCFLSPVHPFFQLATVRQLGTWNIVILMVAILELRFVHTGSAAL